MYKAAQSHTFVHNQFHTCPCTYYTYVCTNYVCIYMYIINICMCIYTVLLKHNVAMFVTRHWY